MDKIKVGILGCTGAVGQKFIALLEGHPLFEISEIAASEKSAGQKYGERVNWNETTPLPENIAGMTIKECTADLDAKILFSALDSSVAGDVETEMANRGYAVVSNSKNHRMDDNVPLLIPEINGDHFALINSQQSKTNGGGFIATSDDVARFANAHMNPGFLKASTLETWTQSQHLKDGKATNYGIGWGSGKDGENRPYFGHTGGSVGGITMMRIYPEEKLVIAILSNSSDVNYGKLTEQLATLFTK